MPGIKILPDEITKEQQHRLGIREPDRWGELWTYVEFPPGQYHGGRIYRDMLSSDLLSSSGVGTPTATSPAGSNVLKDTGEFANKKYLKGALGEITQGAGAGQNFIVLDVPDDNTLIISLDTLNHIKKTQGWRLAIDTTSRYKLVLPGRIVVAAIATMLTRGILQRLGFTVPAGETRYGWLKQTGKIRVTKDNSGVSLSHDEGVVPTTNGLAIATGASNRHLSIGFPVFGEPGGTADVVTLIYGTMQNGLLSHRFPIGREQGYTDNFGNSINI